MDIKITEEQTNFIIKNYGIITKKQISIILNLTINQINKIGKKYNLKSSLSGKILNLNHNFFNNKNMISCYWAGFIAADGCISDKNDIKLCLSNVDIDHLYNFKSTLNAEHKISESKTNNNTYFYFKSPKISKQLKNHYNISCRKSLTLEPPNNLTYEESLAYIIGYIDGDGTIGINTSKYKDKIKKNLRLRIIGTESFLIWINNIFKQKNKPASHSTGKISIISFSNKNLISMLNNFVKENNLPVLKRKWDKIDNFYKENEISIIS